jgi:leucyl-tRNA synthetase
MRFNTAIARIIVLNNHLTGLERVPREAAETLVLLTAPVAPHIAEELWERLGHERSLAHHPFPEANAEFLVDETVIAVVQIQGKVRARLEVSPSIDEAELTALALADPAVIRALDGREVRRVIARPPTLINLVV